MKHHLTFTNVIVVLLLICHGYFIYERLKDKNSSRDYEVLENIVKQNSNDIQEGKEYIKSLDSKIGNWNDTVKIVNNQKTILRENYNSDVASILSADSSLLWKGYLLDLNSSDRMFKDGYYTSR